MKKKLDEEQAKDPQGVYFHGGPFSNFVDSPIVLDHKEYPTVEHRFQAMKAVTPEDHEKIRLARGPAEAKRLGNTIPLRPDWDSVRYTVMVEALRERFQIDRYRIALLDTGAGHLYEDSPTDFVWSFRRSGQNLLGKALEQVRQEIFHRLGQRCGWSEQDFKDGGVTIL